MIIRILISALDGIWGLAGALIIFGMSPTSYYFKMKYITYNGNGNGMTREEWITAQNTLFFIGTIIGTLLNVGVEYY